MTPEQENQLRRLLKLKRYEQPMPGYFDNFSRQVLARLEAGERDQSESLAERLFRSTAWLQSLSRAFESRPALAGAFGALVCAALISGIVFSEQLEAPPQSLVASPGDVGGVHGIVPSDIALGPVAAEPVSMSSTNPFPPSGGTLFDQIRPLDVQPVSGSPLLPGN